MKPSLCAVLPTLLMLAAPAFSAEQADLIIRQATVVDVEHASTQTNQSVVVRGADIVAVGADKAIARQWRAPRQVDAKGRYLIPGLWDMQNSV
jgi:predicted amidohydrolase YtcJ